MCKIYIQMKNLSLLILICLICGCDKEPVDFIYAEYQLPVDYRLNIENDRVVIINDKDTFQEIFSDYSSMKSIDFDKYTLLLVKGTATYGIQEIKKTISKDDDNNYVFSIMIIKNWSTVLQSWHLAFVISKSKPENIIFTVEYDPVQN